MNFGPGAATPQGADLVDAYEQARPRGTHRGSALGGAVEVEVDADGRVVDVVLDTPAADRLQMAELGEGVVAAHREARMKAAQAASDAWQAALDDSGGVPR
jgi:DNA-binding protein YbaB